jgi:signal transduction histidine kinase
VCNHELLASSPQASATDTMPRTPSSRSTPRSKGRRVDDDQSGTRPGDPEMRLARLPTEPVRAEPTAREIQQAIRREACANAVAHDRERIAEGLYDNVIHRLFAAGLQLQATCQTVDAPTQVRIGTTIDLLDATIAELRKAIFSLH